MASRTVDTPVASRAGERRLYVWAAVVAVVVVFAGFSRTFYLKAAYGAPELTTLKLVHGGVMTAWFTFFVVQVWLVASHRTAIHRKLGMAGVVLAAVVVVFGTELGIASARGGFSPVSTVSPFVFLLMPLGEMVVFATLFSAAFLLRNRSAYHKRLMLVASLAMLTPAMARLPVAIIQAGGPPVFFGLTDSVIGLCIAIDTMRNKRLHPAFAAGFGFVIAGELGRLLISQSPQWVVFAKWLVS